MSNFFESEFLGKVDQSVELRFQNEVLGKSDRNQNFTHTEDLIFEQKKVGEIAFEKPSEAITQLKASLASLLYPASNFIRLEKNRVYYEWVKEAKGLAPELCDWTGLYFKASYWNQEESDDLILGPFLGKWTEHTRIPLNQGVCGLALSQEKTFNIPDVKAQPQYLACSLETRSELVIPLKDSQGVFVAELDIDSHTAQAFSKKLVQKMEKFAKSFPDLL